MNSALLSMLDTEETTNVENTAQAGTSTLAEIATLAVLFLSTSAVALLLSLSWVL
ncbi:hypothetical protein [Vibrio sinensis]|uniref:hypothetical protein n=1 Tax=Vibrio sinensis TaxID=2302434 RepID=UPI001403938B|nr:hypothetical protein [Vibrio sinensis]